MSDAITKKWVRCRGDELAVAAGCYFDPAAADKACRFFPTFLRHSKGQFAGQPFTLLDWQANEIIRPLFGWKRPDGTRRFRKAYVEIPKKNGKSTLAAGIGLYLLIGDGEPGAEVYSTAVTRDQAGIVHGEAVNMVKASEGLSSYLRINHATKEILFDRTTSKYKALPAEAGSAEGLNAHGLIIDELHAWTGQHGRKFYDSLRYAGRSRRQPLQFVITTAGDDDLSVCWELHEYAKQVIAGDVIDQRFFGYIRAADPGDNLDDEAVWAKANPSMGETMTAEDFGADLEEAKKTPTAWHQFCRYSFNIWSTGGVAAITAEDWASCRASFTLDELAGQQCWAGIDLSRARDMTALALIFRKPWRIVAKFWLPESTVYSLNAPAHYRAWAEAGLLTATPGTVTDYIRVEADAVELCSRFQVQELAFDPYFAEELTQRIYDKTCIQRVAFAQTAGNFAAPSAEFERLVISGQLGHDGNPILAWQAGNLRWKIDDRGNKRPTKAAGQFKIDGIVAAIMAIGRASLAPEDMNPEVTFL